MVVRRWQRDEKKEEIRKGEGEKENIGRRRKSGDEGGRILRSAGDGGVAGKERGKREEEVGTGE